MIYKRSVNNIEDFKSTEFVLSNNMGVYMNTSVIGNNFAPYHGLFIKQQQKNDQILLAKLSEQIDFGGGEIYDIQDFKTSEKEYGGKEYLVSFDNKIMPVYTYDVGQAKMEKKYKFCKNENILCIEYVISNNSSKSMCFRVKPLITKRNLFEIKRASDMKFVTTNTSNMVKVTLSITEDLNLYLKSSMKFNKSQEFETGVNYDLEIEPEKVKTYVEDLFVPGYFEAVVKGGHTSTINIYVALTDIDNRKFNNYQIDQDVVDTINSRTNLINDSYVELKQLALVSYMLHYIDLDKRCLVLLESIPSFPERADYIKGIISSIEGNYLVLKRYKEAFKILETMMNGLKENGYSLGVLDKCEAELLFIEAVNRYIQESECRNSEVKIFYNYIKETLYSFIDGSNPQAKMDSDFLLMVNGKKHIKINALWYNALRILIFLQDKYYETSEYIYSISENIRDNIVKKFWSSEKSVLKKEASGEAFPNFDMVYTLSLSYPALHEKVAIKLMDTAFKELYTPLGMRLASVTASEYDGFVYPHLMVHFLKANLRQMGVTRATQKLGYNLVKDIFAQIGKYSIGTVKFKYLEKNKKAYGAPIDALTNAEVIRMFDMLT